MLTPDLYEETLLEHGHHPRGEGLLAEATHRAELANPEVGDVVKLSLVVENDVVREVGWEAQGSAMLKASCSLMSEFVMGKSLHEVREMADHFREFLTGPEPTTEELAYFGDVAALSGIRRLPARVKCTLLPWRVLAALQPRSSSI